MSNMIDLDYLLGYDFSIDEGEDIYPQLIAFIYQMILIDKEVKSIQLPTKHYYSLLKEKSLNMNNYVLATYMGFGQITIAAPYGSIKITQGDVLSFV